MKLTQDLVDFLLEKAHYYHHPKFLEADPIQIPHLFEQKEDIEIAGLLTATISWGNRKSILQSSKQLLQWMDYKPYEFVMNYDAQNPEWQGAVHRTFNGEDLHFFMLGLKEIYEEGGLEFWLRSQTDELNYFPAIARLRDRWMKIPHEKRSEKHLPNPLKNASCKRWMMFLRWMVRPSTGGVDFGLWKTPHHQPQKLSLPLDVHTGRVARKLGLLQRSQDDRKAVEELDAVVRKIMPQDPALLDFALFGLGAFENF